MGILIEKECFFLFLRNNFSYFNMECNPYRNLDALAERKTAGELLEPLDEQRLRDHQLLKLRRMWLKDQILSEREPLLPPKKEDGGRVSCILKLQQSTCTLANITMSSHCGLFTRPNKLCGELLDGILFH